MGPGSRLRSRAGPERAVLWFTALTALVTAVISASCRRSRRPTATARGSSRRSRAFPQARWHGLRRLLVATEVALCSTSVTAALLLHSFVNVLKVDKGFVSERVLAVDLSLPERSYLWRRSRIFTTS